MITSLDLALAAPLIALTATVLLVLLAETVRVGRPAYSYGLSIMGIVVALLLAGANLNERTTIFRFMLSVDAVSTTFSIVILVGGLLTVLLARPYLERRDQHRPEFYVLLLFSLVGMLLMASANDLIVVFLGIELMSVCLYVLAGFFRTRDEANESALKYFLLGAFATGFLLYGIALVYGATGTTNLTVISAAYAGVTNQPLFLLGVGLLLVGLGFKVAAVPFHMWAPDVYQGAPTVVTGFMATAGKTAAFGAVSAVFLRAFDVAGSSTADVIALLSAASMIVGNIVAISQTNLKRMLAYSSVAHAGYILAGVASGSHDGLSGVILYLAAYTATTIGAFGVIGWIERDSGDGVNIEDFTGLGKHQPAVAALLALFMFSLAGIPPFAGFVGKYYVFLAAVRANMTWLAVVGVLTSAISADHYLRVVVTMYFREREGDALPLPRVTVMLALGISAFLVLLIGILPSLVLDLFGTSL